MNYQYIDVTHKDHVTTIMLNRPDKLNALNTPMMMEIKDALQRIKTDENTRVLVLKGAGKAFCTGADLSEFKDQEPSPYAIRERANLTMEVNNLFRKLGKPVLSSVHKYVFAGGCGLALAADMVIASIDAEFSYPEIQRGFVAALVMTNLTRLVGRRNAFDMLVTGRRVEAEEALTMGLINKVVARDQLEEETMKLASELAKRSPTAMQMTKDLFYRVSEMHVEDAMASAKDTNMLMRTTDDFKKGVDRFVNKS